MQTQAINIQPPSGHGPLQILHLGLGSFHRAHQAAYIQRLLDRGDTAWRLVAGNLRADMADTLQALAAQNGGYTLETVSPSGERQYQVIHAIHRIVPFDPMLQGLVDAGADPATRIVSFTVTEAGYYLDAGHRLDVSHADVRGDIDGRTRCTIYGALAAILDARRRAGSGAVTLLNCDNLRCNGERVHEGLRDFLRQRGDTGLLAWMETHTRFPNAMVDRITPRPTPEVSARVKAATGWGDRVPVMAESFIQWVVEDDFIHGRPDWEAVGVEMVASVLPYEEAKIRILNASHSCIAWAGTLLGMGHIHEAVAHPGIRRMAFDYVTQAVIPCLDRPGERCPIDLAAYRDVVLERFGNPHLHDSTQRVAMDGYSKIAGFMWPTFQELLALGAPIDPVARLTALFFEFLRRWHHGRLPYAYQDQGMDPAKAHAIFEADDPLLAFAGDAALWGPLAGHPEVLAALHRQQREVSAFVQANGG